jgi:hypothetical protein
MMFDEHFSATATCTAKYPSSSSSSSSSCRIGEDCQGAAHHVFQKSFANNFSRIFVSVLFRLYGFFRYTEAMQNFLYRRLIFILNHSFVQFSAGFIKGFNFCFKAFCCSASAAKSMFPPQCNRSPIVLCDNLVKS